MFGMAMQGPVARRGAPARRTMKTWIVLRKRMRAASTRLSFMDLRRLLVALLPRLRPRYLPARRRWRASCHLHLLKSRVKLVCVDQMGESRLHTNIITTSTRASTTTNNTDSINRKIHLPVDFRALYLSLGLGAVALSCMGMETLYLRA